MQREIQRHELIASFNRLFGVGEIEATAARLQPLLPAIDALEIVYRLGLLPWVPVERFLRYREVVGIPPVNMQVLTVTLHGALRAQPRPVPLVLDIVQGAVETVAVSHPGGHIAVTLTRTTIDPLVMNN